MAACRDRACSAALAAFAPLSSNYTTPGFYKACKAVNLPSSISQLQLDISRESIIMASMQRYLISVLLIVTAVFLFFVQTSEAVKGPKITHKVSLTIATIQFYKFDGGEGVFRYHSW